MCRTSSIFNELAANGFVVLASQYRGNDGGEGLEQFGGADVGDVETLVSLASSLPYADPKNIFFYGLSRGGMMTFLALARGVTVNAAAVVGGIYDLQGLMAATKLRMPGVANRVMTLIPDYSSRGAAALAERSVMAWPEKLAVPLLMIQWFRGRRSAGVASAGVRGEVEQLAGRVRVDRVRERDP